MENLDLISRVYLASLVVIMIKIIIYVDLLGNKLLRGQF